MIHASMRSLYNFYVAMSWTTTVFVFFMFDTVFYVKLNSSKNMFSSNVFFVLFVFSFFQHVIYFFRFLILYLSKILHLKYLSKFTVFWVFVVLLSYCDILLSEYFFNHMLILVLCCTVDLGLIIV